MPSELRTSVLTALFVVTLTAASAEAAETKRTIDFSREIRPILADSCFKCHGPDEQQRTSGLRLDTQDGALAEIDGRRAIVPGDPAASELLKRIHSQDPELRMPPSDAGRDLTPQQRALLEEWIRQGASWSEHWSFRPLQAPEVPDTKDSSWSRNAIDHFVLKRLEAEELQPAEEADRLTLARRVSLDLTGLPPSPEALREFLADQSPEAYSNYVNRLLDSVHYGERMAIDWLDQARYADTSGYQNDGPRSMWRWRDWVIEAFNSNMPFDQFTTEQIAGDLLPDATVSQQIATAFNRNHRGNAEGGIIPEEYQVEYVVDRVDTTFTVWMGLTMGCARCHDHKYDPIRQRDYYQTFAYFNNISEAGRAIKEGNSPPFIKAPLPEQSAVLTSLDRRIEEAQAEIRSSRPELERAFAAWQTAGSGGTSSDWTLTGSLESRFHFDGDLTDRISEGAAPFAGDPVEFSSEADGRIQSVRLDGRSHVVAGDIGAFGYLSRFTLATWMRPAGDTGTIISRMTPESEGDGYYVHLQNGYLQVNLVKRWLDDALRLQSRDKLPLDEWQHIAVVYDGSRTAESVRVYHNGRPLAMDVQVDLLNQTFLSPEPLRIGGGQQNFQGSIDDVHVYSRDLSEDEVRILAVRESIAEILAKPVSERSEAEQRKLLECFIQNEASESLRKPYRSLVELRQERRDYSDAIPTVMVMQEMATPRKTHILVRGQYDNPGEVVNPGTPSFLPPLSNSAPGNRLGFAQWLVSPEHPLTARVTVNRFWQRFFGAGLVRTSEDFGVQGDPPSHPELLDWLSAEFIRNGWNMKAIQKLIVLSATYRQSSRVTPELLRLDPENRLLARGPRFRLPAETIRDQALFVSGLLSPSVGGPSVKPYQPDGLWKEIATDMDYAQSHGQDLYRRSLYTYWKRTVAPPGMVTLDASSREACTVQRPRTNTPLQALALMNDTTFLEAARVLAQRVLSDPSRAAVSEESIVGAIFERVAVRQPHPQETAVLLEALQKYRDRFRSHPESARQLIRIGEYPVNEALNPVELASYTTLTSLILNLDEVICSE